MSGYSNPDFDRSMVEMDPTRRRELMMKMQGFIARDLPYIPLYKPSVVEATRRDRFHGWVKMLEGIGNIWSLCTVKPVAAHGA